MEKMSVCLTNIPQLSGHRKDDSRVGNVGKRRLLILQPFKGSPVSATGAESRFAPVVATFFFVIGGIYLPAKSRGSAINYLSKVPTYFRSKRAANSRRASRRIFASQDTPLISQ